MEFFFSYILNFWEGSEFFPIQISICPLDSSITTSLIKTDTAILRSRIGRSDLLIIEYLGSENKAFILPLKAIDINVIIEVVQISLSSCRGVSNFF